MSQSQEKLYFQTEAAELLDMMIHSVYSNKDIFLRELISNASDALDKRRVEALSNGEYSTEYKAEIRIARDKDKKTITISDNGVGMTRDDIANFIGTIAKSGTKEFLANAKKNGTDGVSTQEMLIGQFGVGFYSAFMVSDRVELFSRRLGTMETWKFDSTGDGSYTLNLTEGGDALPECGTKILLYLKKSASSSDASGELGGEDKDYTDEWTLRDLVRQYSDFISYPIVMNCSKWKDKVETVEDETINSQKAIWCKSESEVTDEEYLDFYKRLSRDWKEPLTRFALNAEGTVSFRGLMFIPSQAPMDLLINNKSGGISLYIKRVFIMNDCTSLMPEYLRFMKGVVDSEDLPLNISREILQDDQRIRVIRRSILRKFFSHLRKMREDEREKYEKFWKNFGRVFKEGAVQDQENADTILELSLFHSTNEESQVTLSDYKSRMKQGQEGVYYIIGRDTAALKGSPKLEAFAAKGYEVLLLTDSVDEVIMARKHEYKPKDDETETKFLDVSAGDVNAKNEDERKEAAKKIEGLEADFAPLKERIKKSLESALSDVRLSMRMTSSPACLVSDSNAASMQMEQLMRAMGQEVPASKRILELNPEHAVVRGMMRLASAGDERLEDFASVLYDQAVILDGGTIADPARFSRLLAEIMNSALEAKA
ncbi:chaperone protein HtpG [Synergistales bacterium]|nr:chaperone protein HtpG [Synergistales bacterium]